MKNNWEFLRKMFVEMSLYTMWILLRLVCHVNVWYVSSRMCMRRMLYSLCWQSVRMGPNCVTTTVHLKTTSQYYVHTIAIVSAVRLYKRLQVCPFLLSELFQGGVQQHFYHIVLFAVYLQLFASLLQKIALGGCCKCVVMQFWACCYMFVWLMVVGDGLCTTLVLCKRCQ